MIFSHVRYVSGRSWRFQNPLVSDRCFNLTLLVVSGCFSGLLSNYCQKASPTYPN